MSTRELWRNIMHYGPFDRLPVIHWAAWPETVQRWRDEGMPVFADHEAERRWFGAEASFWGIGCGWHGDGPGMEQGLFPAFEEKVLEDHLDHQVVRGGDGVVRKRWKDHTGVPHCINYTLKDASGWEEYKARLQSDPRRLTADLDRSIAMGHASGNALGITVCSLMGWIRNWMGVQNMAYLIYDDPAVYADMVNTLADLSCWIIDAIAPKVQLDLIFGWEDMCGKSGPLVSPATFDKHVAPGYRKVRAKAEEYGIGLYGIDTDGDITHLCGHWLEAGVNVQFPIEIGTWNADPMAYRRKYGRELRILGGIDKRELAKGRAAIDAEIERRMPIIKDGGFLPMPDHLVPPDVPLDDYRYYLERIREIRV